MPRIEGKTKDSAPRSDHRGDGPSRSSWHASDEAWRNAVAAARSRVLEVIDSRCNDAALAKTICSRICCEVEIYVRSLVHVKKRKSSGRTIWRREFLAKPLAGVEALKRLGSSHTPYALARA